MGICDEPTNLTDSHGEELFVSDLVVVFSEEYKSYLNLCDLEYIVNDADVPFIMGLKNSYQKETEYYINGELSNEKSYDFKADYYISSNSEIITSRWLIKKVKGYEDIVVGEKWGSGNVTVKMG